MSGFAAVVPTRSANSVRSVVDSPKTLHHTATEIMVKETEIHIEFLFNQKSIFAKIIGYGRDISEYSPAVQ